MVHITRMQMIQLRSHYKNGKTVEELAVMINAPTERIIGLLGLQNKPVDPEPVIETEGTDPKEENWEE